MSDRVSIANARRVDQDLAGRPSPTPTGADPYMVGWTSRLRASGYQLETGQIVDAVPGGAVYLVDAGQASFVWCSPGGTVAGFGTWGARPLHTFPIGSYVIFARHPQTPTHGTIVSAEPHWLANTALHPADGVWPFTRSGQRVESAHRYPVDRSAAIGSTRAGGGGGVDMPDLSAGRPIDQTGVGEWGVMAETGVGVFADPFQAYLRVDEATGVFAFYTDQLLRVAGHNYQHFTSHVDREELDDAGELAGFSRRCIYPWEMYGGLWRPNQVTPVWKVLTVPDHGLPPGQGTKFVSPFISQDGSGDAVREPERYDLIPAARIYEWFGYLGQGGREVIALPAQLEALLESPGAIAQARDMVITKAEPENAPAGRVSIPGEGVGPADLDYLIPPNNRTQGTDQPGVLEVTKSVDGGYRIRSARHIILAKRPAIPTPRQKLRPEDPAGDTSDNYRPSGWAQFGGGDEHKVKYNLDLEELGPQATGCVLPEILAYLFNWQGLAPFAYHAEDWHVAQEGNTGVELVNQQTPNFLALETDQYLSAPTPKLVDVDHRYGNEVPIFENEAHVCLLDDGTVQIGDGWGSAIRMSGGNVEIHAAGDIAFYAGRNRIDWAGHDAVIRAHDSIDITAANGDLRTKAERNSHHLAGNSGCGGFIYEAKTICAAHRYADRVGEAVTSSGFLVIAPNSQFSVLSGDAAIVLAETSSDGRIYLDAGYSRHIHTYSRTVVNRVSPGGSVVHLFDGSGINPEPAANEFAAAYTLLSKDAMLRGGLYVAGTANFGRRVNARGVVSEFSDVDMSEARGTVTARVSYLVDTYKEDYHAEVSLPPHAAEAEFTCRTRTQYLSDAFEVFEPKWRAVARAAAVDLPLWYEPPVIGLRSAAYTLPHPGERWDDETGYRAYTHTLVDTENGWVAVDRDDGIGRGQYETAITTPLSSNSLSAYYSVTVPPGTG